ncbi:HAD family hydrolase [Larkinella knui]|uniref:HAD family hydrolase n=1 Tax=Larkinella knui TaxID=2025310 RepID=A0A3P1CX76_9BACT|nr:HAD family hydrolase [Larkinella knui]RRB17893.1 HAD family hydrolase [Larkinella knui]
MIKGVLLDYGGTIDTNGLHWGGVLWAGYQKYRVPVDKAAFSKAYSFGERALAIHPIVKPEHSFYEVLYLKIEQQFAYLTDNGYTVDKRDIATVAADCNAFAQRTVEKAKPVLTKLADRYPLVMVSNFYGNLNTVLTDFGIRSCFKTVVESAVVGIRKPDPEIYRLGVTQLQLPAENCVVVGDSYSKDIRPGKAAGCQTVWLNVAGWEETNRTSDPFSEADAELTDFAQLPELLTRLNG